MLGDNARPRALVVVNPNAARGLRTEPNDLIAKLASRWEVEARATAGRHSAIAMSAEAAAAGMPLVVAFGGDGLVNEVANGLAGTPSCLGIIPGGTMNVFARSLGMPVSLPAAVDHLVEAARLPARDVTLGRLDDRYFTFAGGCGFDAEAAERVERDVAAKRRLGEVFFYWSAFRVLASAYRHRNPDLVLSGDFGAIDAAMVIGSNTGPYAFCAGRRVELAPDVRLESGIDVFALTKMRLRALPSYAYRSVVTGDLARRADAFYAANLDAFEVTSTEPFSRHVDGEPLGASTSARFSVVHGALKVLA